MSLKETISRDLGAAMKAHDEIKTGVLRMLASAVHSKAIDKRAKQGAEELSDEEIIDVFRTEVKKRREAAEIFTKANRADLAEKELAEITVIEHYLPAQMNAEAVQAAVTQILAKGSYENFGEAMKATMAELKGKADAKLVSDAVRKTIGK